MKSIAKFAIMGIAVFLTGCGGVTDALGFGRNSPDEFAVVERPPLSIPPDFTLRPPKPGAPRPQEVKTDQTAASALFGAKTDSAATTNDNSSDAEKALLESAGAANADSEIRDQIDRDAAKKAAESSPSFIDSLMWWRDSTPPETTVDAPAEADRLRADKASGEPANQGATPALLKTHAICRRH